MPGRVQTPDGNPGGQRPHPRHARGWDRGPGQANPPQGGLTPMPYEEGTLTDEDVADELKLGDAIDPVRLTRCTDAARSWAERICSSTLPSDLWSDPDRHRGGVLEGCFQYLRRAAPGGMPSYDDSGSDVWTLHMDAERMLSPDAVIA